MTKEEFILRTKEIYNNKFIYPNLSLNINSNKDKIIILCPLGHIFKQSVRNHLYKGKRGCPLCHPHAPITFEKFINQTKSFNKGQYDYSLITNFKSGRDKINIKCTIDNTIFSQYAYNHLKYPKKCPTCKINKRKELLLQLKHPPKIRSHTNSQFISRSRKRYKEIFDYSLVNYKNKRIKVCLKCKKNGHIFWQSPESHFKGNDCPKCIGAGQYSQEDFLFKARLVHGDRYDLSNIKYIASNQNITVRCLKHGNFIIRASRFLRGQKCRKCNSNIFVTTQDEFIAKAKEIHLDRFDLSQINFIKSSYDVTPICKKHGMFRIQACKFLSGRGCKRCKISEGERIIENFLKKNNILYIHEKKFSDCISKLPLKFDFYLPEYRTCVEYDGIGHYSDRVYGQKSFQDTIKSDQIKNNYCLINGITLIRINSFKLIHIILTELIYPIII